MATGLLLLGARTGWLKKPCRQRFVSHVRQAAGKGYRPAARRCPPPARQLRGLFTRRRVCRSLHLELECVGQKTVGIRRGLVYAIAPLRAIRIRSVHGEDELASADVVLE